MINFFIYEKDEKTIELYENIIKNFFYKTDDCYKVYKYRLYTNELLEQIKKTDGFNIYLINIDIEDNKGISLAKNIRKYDNYKSFIVMTSDGLDSNVAAGLTNLLIFNIFFDKKNIIKELYKSISKIYEVITSSNALVFTIFDEMYRVKYSDIYYIEKHTNNDYLTIYTKDDSYIYYSSIKDLIKILGHDARFVKTHRSCIINLHNLISYDRVSNNMTFVDGHVSNLVSRAGKPILIERLLYTDKYIC